MKKGTNMALFVQNRPGEANWFARTQRFRRGLRMILTAIHRSSTDSSGNVRPPREIKVSPNWRLRAITILRRLQTVLFGCSGLEQILRPLRNANGLFQWKESVLQCRPVPVGDLSGWSRPISGKRRSFCGEKYSSQESPGP